MMPTDILPGLVGSGLRNENCILLHPHVIACWNRYKLRSSVGLPACTEFVSTPPEQVSPRVLPLLAFRKMNCQFIAPTFEYFRK